jgi:hypothetical protein
MSLRPVQVDPMDDRRLSRRELLTDAARLAGAGLVVSAGGRAAAQTPASRTAASQPVSQPAGPQRSRVVQSALANVFSGPIIRPDLLDHMLSMTLMALTEKPRIGDAWHAILKSDDVIGIKFNRSGSEEIRTTPVFARVLVQSLLEAEFPAKNILLIEGPEAIREKFGTTQASPEWSKPLVDFGSGRDRFAEVLDQATAIINVPFLKTHNIAGMTCCLKNLSHGLIRQPSRFHANRCSPYIADIVAAAPIRSKVRLHLVNALRSVIDQGPEVRPDSLWDSRTVLASFDPVAADTVGLEMLNLERRRRQMSPLDDDEHPIPFLGAAHSRGLGTNLGDEIQIIQPRL